MTDATLAALLRDVLDVPDDDDARLRYADRLDELGDAEHAEFIRIQVELARVPESEETTQCSIGPYDVRNHCVACRKLQGEYCRYHVLLCRADAIASEKNQGRWAGSPLSMGRAFGTYPIFWPWQFRRGFVESVTCASAVWFTHADAILAAHPVREVTLTTLPADWWCGYHQTFTYAPRAAMVHSSLKEKWPGITFHLPAEMDENGGYVVPENLAPAIESLHAGGGVLHGPIHQLAPPGWTP